MSWFVCSYLVLRAQPILICVREYTCSVFIQKVSFKDVGERADISGLGN